MSDKTVQKILQKSMEQDIAKKQKDKLKILQSKADNISPSGMNLPELDKKEIESLKHQWNELMIETLKLKIEYELSLKEIYRMKEITLAINNGNTWKYKLARWLVR